MGVAVNVHAYGPPGELLNNALVDHLYPNCPALRRQCRGQEPQRLSGILALVVDGVEQEEWRNPDGLVDPEGTDICGWCRRVWRTRQRS
jgi:hypothetical protein